MSTEQLAIEFPTPPLPPWPQTPATAPRLIEAFYAAHPTLRRPRRDRAGADDGS